jgi:hypothetical protein
MQTLKDAASMTSELDRLGEELHAELTTGEINFEKMVKLADSISETADRLAGAFSAMAGALSSLDASADDEQGESGNGSQPDEQRRSQ